MVIERFPPIERADETGLLAVGGDLDVDSLLLAYRSGIFPWPIDEDMLAWFCPPERTILRCADLHVPESLKKVLKRGRFTYELNKNFPQVIENCRNSKNRGKQRGTWITEEVVSAYNDLFLTGHAFSSEAYLDGELVGGLYGVNIGSFFAGESMYYIEPNASKAALWFLIERLSAIGVEWLDCQVMTPHLKKAGAISIDRDEYLNLLEGSISRPLPKPLLAPS